MKKIFNIFAGAALLLGNFSSVAMAENEASNHNSISVPLVNAHEEHFDNMLVFYRVNENGAREFIGSIPRQSKHSHSNRFTQSDNPTELVVYVTHLKENKRTAYCSQPTLIDKNTIIVFTKSDREWAAC